MQFLNSLSLSLSTSAYSYLSSHFFFAAFRVGIRPLIKCQSPTHPLPLSPPFVLTFHCPSLPPLSVHRLSSSTASCRRRRPFYAQFALYLLVRTRVSGEPPPLNHHARDRHTHRDIVISCVNYRSPPFSRFRLPVPFSLIPPRPPRARCFIAGDRGMRRG